MVLISNNVPKGFDLAAQIAVRSDHSLHKMGAVISRRGLVLGCGWNQNKTHPRSKNYYHTIHAELSAILRTAKRYSLMDSTMHIVRVTKGGKLATSKPCDECEILLREAGLKSVTFIGEDGLIWTKIL
jgi:deoxycytidylate deaminase